MKHQSTACIALTLELQNYAEYYAKLKTNKSQTFIQIEVYQLFYLTVVFLLTTSSVRDQYTNAAVVSQTEQTRLLACQFSCLIILVLSSLPEVLTLFAETDGDENHLPLAMRCKSPCSQVSICNFEDQILSNPN